MPLPIRRGLMNSLLRTSVPGASPQATATTPAILVAGHYRDPDIPGSDVLGSDPEGDPDRIISRSPSPACGTT
jgi:hypothetical protein